MHKALLAAAAALIALTASAAAQDWPTRPMTLVVPFAAGGGVDLSARIQAQRMSELLGQTIIVEERVDMLLILVGPDALGRGVSNRRPRNQSQA